MYKQFAILLFLLIFVCKLNLAQSNSFIEQDSLLYDSFLRENWSEVINYGKKMTAEGYDYYYLHIRMGIAAYNNSRYLLARKYLLKALRFYQNDPVANSYLYGTYLMLNQKNEAGIIASNLTDSDKQSWGINDQFKLTSIHADIGMQNFNHQHPVNFNTISGGSNIYGQTREYLDQSFWDAGINLQLNSSINGYVGLQQIAINADDIFAFQTYELTNDSVAYADWGASYYYKIDSSRNLKRFNHNIKQQSFYGNISFGITKNLRLTTAVHVIKWDQTQTQARIENSFLSDTAYYLYDGSETVFFEIPLPILQFETLNTKSTEWVLFLGSTLQSQLGESSFSASLSKISGAEFIQLKAGQKYYPFGNLNFYGNTSFSFLNGDNRNDWLVCQSFYFRLFKQNWIEASWSHGNHSAFNTNNAFLVYNTPYQPQNRYNAILYAQISKNIKLRLSYSKIDGRHIFTNSDPVTIDNSQSFLSYESNLITGGIQWNF